MKIIKSLRKTLSLQIKNGEILVKAPFFMREKTIKTFIEKHQKWIDKKLESSKKISKKIFQEWEKFYFLWEEKILKIWRYEKKIYIEGDNIFLNKENKKSFKEIFLEFYKKEAREYITKRVEHYAEKNNFSYNKIKITTANTRWGSCSSKKNLNFTYKLIMAPKEVIDYVVVHELCHLKEMNHSKSFWNEVQKIIPNYKKKSLWLKEKWYLLNI